MSLFGKKAVKKADNKNQSHGLKVILIVTLWLSAIVTSMAFINHYSNIPGPLGLIPHQWPKESHITLDPKRPTLVMFAHPCCPCTRASIAELEQLMSDNEGKLSAQVWFIKPAGTSENWADTDLWRTAAAIPGVTVHRDDDGTEAQRFQIKTSGQTVLYGPDGQLLFHGGITLSRGHAGDNAGLSTIESLLDHKISEQTATPVFGCLLFSEATGKKLTGGPACKQ